MPTSSYPKHLLVFDGLRAGLGIAVTAGPLLFLDVSRPLVLVFGALAVLFLWFGYRVLTQCTVTISSTSDGLLYQGWRQFFLPWRDLRGLKLAYYAPMRRRSAGWYQLTLKGNSRSLSLDSTLIGFDHILQSAIDAATDADLTFDASTSDNLQAWRNRDATSDQPQHPATADSA